MNVLHLASSNRWTGAAAPAFAEVEALRGAGVNAHYAYVGGYRLEDKIGLLDHAHPLIAKRQDPFSFADSARAIKQLCSRLDISILHAHLTYDHALARFSAFGNSRLRLVRTFHSRRALRRDPLSSLLASGTTICVVNQSFLSITAEQNFTPPPLDTRQFKVEGSDMRSAYEIPGRVPVVAVIGKIAPGRGFEDALRTFAHIRVSITDARLLIIGHGPHRPVLESLSAELGISGSIIWAGYHEEDLAQHYRTADVLLFTAAGSDEGHRAVLESMGSGTPVTAYDLPGIRPLLGSRVQRLVAPSGDPVALAERAAAILRGRSPELRQEVALTTIPFDFEHSAGRLIEIYRSL